MAHAQTQKITLYTMPVLLLALFILVACGGSNPSVATSNTPSGIDCTVTGNSFNAACRNEPAAAAGRLELCSGTIADLTAAGGSRDACNTATLANAICVSSGPNANPFAPICISERTRTLEATLTIYEVQEKYCTETNFFDHSCTGALVECDDEGVCSDPVNPLRLTACTDYAGDATALTNAGGTVASCDSPLLAGVICGTATSVGTNPFAAICSEARGNSDFANIADRQIAYCSENTEAGTCPMVISTFCGTADGPKSQTLCPSQYRAATTAPATVTAVASKAKTRNVADTAEATVLEEIEGGAYTSYVDAVAGTNKPTFDFGDSVDAAGDAKTGVSIIQDGLLLSELVFKESNDDSALTNVANDEGTELANIGNTDGFAIARVDNPAFTPNGGGALDTKARFYAGLLTTTDLGAPLSDRSADGIWTAEFVAIVSDSNSKGRTGRSIATRSTLRVSFADKTIQTREVGSRFTPVARTASAGDPKPSNPTDFYDGSRIIIDGRFNVEGVIFGESSWIYDGKTSRGSVSGLIGIEGAVGAFVSNGQNNGVNSNGEYAGGFVASNECAIIPFHASCADRHFQGLRDARIRLCADGTQSTNPLCMQAGVTAITTPCTANPFAAPCNTTYAKQYEPVRNTLLDICRGANHATADCSNAMSTVCSYLYYPFAPLCGDNTVNEDNYCRYTNPFDKTNCIDGEANNEVIERQRTFCGGRDLVNAQTSAFYTECTRTIQGFCGTGTVMPEPISNLFSSTCSADNFNVARGRACLDGYIDSTTSLAPTRCGDETTNGNYIHAYCDSDAGLTNLRECPVAYARKNPVVSTVSLADFTRTGENQLFNRDRSGALTIVASGGASLDDASTNFITGGVDRLDLGLADDKTVGTRTLSLNELGSNDDDATSGFTLAIGLIDNAGTDIYKQYVGLLSGTNLGAPLSDDMHGGTWDAKLRIRISKIQSDSSFLSTTVDSNFKLNVNFGAKTLNIVNNQGGNITITLDREVDIFHFEANPVFSIRNGKFTDNGVIYGTTNLDVSYLTGQGILTGLIGQDGAVGIFASDNSNFDYVGGFVAAPTTPDQVITEDFTKWEESFRKGEINGVNDSLRSSLRGNRYPLRNSNFISAPYTANYIKLNADNKIAVGGTALNTTILRLNETPGETGYNIGFAYAFNTATAPNDVSSSQTYSALLPTVDVGPPISYLENLVFWKGKIAGTFGGTDFIDETFRLHIIFNSGTQAGTIRSVRDGTSFDGRTYLITGPVSGKTSSTNHIDIRGEFNSNGVMSGLVDFNGGTGYGLAGTSGGGVFSGLIGTQAAVGVFNGVVVTPNNPGNNPLDTTSITSTPYSGGFVVQPIY